MSSAWVVNPYDVDTALCATWVWQNSNPIRAYVSVYICEKCVHVYACVCSGYNVLFDLTLVNVYELAS